MAKPAAIRVEGLSDVLYDLRRLGNEDVPLAIKLANLHAAETVRDQAVIEVPRRSGRLAKSIKALASKRAGRVKAGSAKRVPYAGPIHFGWARRRIRPNPFLYRAADKRVAEVHEAYQKQVDEAVAKFNG